MGRTKRGVGGLRRSQGSQASSSTKGRSPIQKSHLSIVVDGTRLTLDLWPLLYLLRGQWGPSVPLLVGGVVHADRILQVLNTMRRWHRVPTRVARIQFARARLEARKMEIELAQAGWESDLLCDLITARKDQPDIDDLRCYTLADVHEVHPIAKPNETEST